MHCARPGRIKFCRAWVGCQLICGSLATHAFTSGVAAHQFPILPAAWGLIKQAKARHTRTHSRGESQDSSRHRVGSRTAPKAPSRDSSRSSVSSQDRKGVEVASHSNASPREAVRRPLLKAPSRLFRSFGRQSHKRAAAEEAEPDVDSLEAVHAAPGNSLPPAAAADGQAESTQQWVQLGPS